MVETISRDELKAKMDRGENFFLVEALDKRYYQHSHLPGAINLPPKALDRAEELLPERGAGDDAEELERRREKLGRRLAAKQAEKDRYIRLYAQDHISEEELETYLLDLKNQTENLRLLLGSVEAELSQKRAHQGLTETAHVWLVALRERIAEVEEDTEEAFRVRRQLVKLLVQSIIVGKNHEGCIEVRITYRFGPPGGASEG